ncbi:MAG: DUF805 domain-containing protein [bacterium]|nr:DUF805 domain-containing protein [bacterium]
MKTGLREFANFSGTTTRYEYGWFLLFFVVVTAVATILHESIPNYDRHPTAALPRRRFRRLNDAGHSPWWQFFWLVPFGQIVVLILLAQPGRGQSNPPVTKSLDAA